MTHRIDGAVRHTASALVPVHLGTRTSDTHDHRYTVTHEATGVPGKPWMARVAMMPIVVGDARPFSRSFLTRSAAADALVELHDSGYCPRCSPSLVYVGSGRSRGLDRAGYRLPLPRRIAEEVAAMRTFPVFSLSVDGRVLLSHATMADRLALLDLLKSEVVDVEHRALLTRVRVRYSLEPFSSGRVTR